MLRRIRIQRYKSLHDMDVRLQELAILLGPNGAGKSNFLDALQLLSRVATSRTLKDSFEPPYRGTPIESATFGPDGMKGLLREDSVTFRLEADVHLSDTVVSVVNRRIRDMRGLPASDEERTAEAGGLVRERDLRYAVTIEVRPQSGVLRMADEYLAALTNQGEVDSRRKPLLELVDDRRLHLRMEGQAHPRYFERYLDYSVLSQPLYPPHYPHLVAMREELASWRFFYFEPRERMRSANPVKEVHHIGLMGEDLAAYLNTLRTQEPRQFQAVERALRMIIPSITGIEVGPNDLGEVDLRVVEGSMVIPARVLSEGTLRLLGLLALGGVKEPPALVGFEEPENGIHPQRIRLVAELLRARVRTDDTQIIATTHSPLLADAMPSEYLHVCRRDEQGYTVIQPIDRWGPLFQNSAIADRMDGDEEAAPVSSRMLRGDFEAAITPSPSAPN